MSLIIPYYAFRPSKAARFTTRLLMDEPDLDIVRMGWNYFGESWLACQLSLFRAPKIAVRREIFVEINGSAAGRYRRNPTDICVRIFSPRPMTSVKNGTWENSTVKLSSTMSDIGLPSKRHVLLYVHGGGFFGRFIAKDLYNLSDWAATLGIVIVYIGNILILCSYLTF